MFVAAAAFTRGLLLLVRLTEEVSSMLSSCILLHYSFESRIANPIILYCARMRTAHSSRLLSTVASLPFWGRQKKKVRYHGAVRVVYFIIRTFVIVLYLSSPRLPGLYTNVYFIIILPIRIIIFLSSSSFFFFILLKKVGDSIIS